MTDIDVFAARAMALAPGAPLLLTVTERAELLAAIRDANQGVGDDPKFVAAESGADFEFLGHPVQVDG